MTIITVFDGVSQVGISVVKALSRDYEVRLATTNPNDASALQSDRLSIVKVDPDDERSIYDAIQGSHGCFIITNTDFECASPFFKELEQGKKLANACDKARVRHVVFCTQLSVVKTTGLSAQHMDAKADIEAYMQHLRLPLTCIILPITYESLLMPPLRPLKAASDSYELAIPTGTLPIDMISVEDVGVAVKSLFSMGDSTLFKTISLTGDKLSVRDMASIMSKYLAPKRIKDKQVTIEQFTRRDFPGAQDLAAMFNFYIRVDQRASVELTQSLSPGLQSFPQWVHQNVKSIHKALDFPNTPERDIWA